MGARSARTLCLLAVALGVLCVPSAAVAQVEVSPNNPSSARLVEHPEAWDGQTVEFTGEAIGERMVRGDMAWIHLNDDAYYLKNVEEGAALGGYNTGMPVWIGAALTDGIEYYGDYKHEGDVVKVTGVFNAACSQHGGDMDIHATELTREIPGRRAQDPVKRWKIPVAVLLLLVAAVLWWADRTSAASLQRGLVTRKRA